MQKKNYKKIITAIGIFLLLGVFGCGTQQENTSQISIHPTTKENPKQDKLSALPDKIQDILYKDGEFYDVERKQTYTKSSYQIDIWEYENAEKKKVYWEEYLVLDLDKDGQQELLVRIKNKNSPEPATRIFDAEEDTVYCYSYVYRATQQVYADGVILGSSGASINAFYSLKFKNGKAEETVIAESKSREGTTECDYFIEGRKVSSDDFFAYCDKYNSMGGEEWTPFDEHSKEQQEHTSSISPKPTTKENSKQDKLSALPDKIQDILYKNGEFYDVERKQTYTKSSYQVDIWEYENDEKKKVYWEEYLVLDLDQDGQMELLVRVKNKNSPDPFTRIFDAEEDTVYCYSYVGRAVLHVYADGVILGSSGAAYNTFYLLNFKNGKAEETIVAETKGTGSGCDFFVGKEKVSEEKYCAIVEKYYDDNDDYTDEKWMTFDKQNETQQKNPDNTSPEAATNENPKQDKLSALPDKIQDILYKNGEFYDVEKKQTYTKSSYQIDVRDYEERKVTVYWKKYLVLDLDKDGQMELLVRVSNDADAINATRIFDVQQDKVYCYSYWLNETRQVYADGTIYRGGYDLYGEEVNNAFFSLTFKGEKATETIVAESKSKTGGYDYFVEKKPVSPDEFYAYTKKYNSKDEGTWINFDEN